MNEDDYQFNLRVTREALEEIAPKYPLLPGLVYRSMYDFVLEHGREYQPVRWSSKYERGVQLQCYGNAIAAAAKYDLRYIEGISLAPTGEIIPHAWNADAGGGLVDVTWCNTGLMYLGVEFSIERADDATWNGDGHVLNDENRGYPIYRQRWQGEDYSRAWPPSDRLEAIKVWRETGVYREPPSVRKWLRLRPRQTGRSNPLGGSIIRLGEGSHGERM